MVLPSVHQHNPDCDIWVHEYFTPSWFCLPNNKPVLTAVRPGDTARDTLELICKVWGYLGLLSWEEQNAVEESMNTQKRVAGEGTFKNISISFQSSFGFLCDNMHNKRKWILQRWEERDSFKEPLSTCVLDRFVISILHAHCTSVREFR